jgi:hypothetical protein
MIEALLVRPSSIMSQNGNDRAYKNVNSDSAIDDALLANNLTQSHGTARPMPKPNLARSLALETGAVTVPGRSSGSMTFPDSRNRPRSETAPLGA